MSSLVYKQLIYFQITNCKSSFKIDSGSEQWRQQLPHFSWDITTHRNSVEMYMLLPYVVR